MTSGEDIQVQPMKVRGATFDVWVTHDGLFGAKVNEDNIFHATTYAELREKLMRATKVAAAKVEVPFTTMVSGIPERGIVTGVHSANRNLMVFWPDRLRGSRHQREQVQSYSLSPSLRVLSQDETAEWMRLTQAHLDAQRELRDWEQARGIDLRKAIEAATDAAVEGMQ